MFQVGGTTVCSDLFYVELPQERYRRGLRYQEVGRGKDGQLYPALHCHHQTDFPLRLEMMMS